MWWKGKIDDYFNLKLTQVLGSLEIYLLGPVLWQAPTIEILWWNFSSTKNEVIRPVLNFLLLFFDFHRKISQAQRSTKPLTANKNKKCV